MAGMSYGIGHRFWLCCVLWPWLLLNNFRPRSWQILGSWTTIAWNIILIELGRKEYFRADKCFVYVCTVTLTLEIPCWVHVMTTLVWSIIPIQVTREKLWSGQMKHLWVVDKNCVKYHPHPSKLWKVMAQKQFFVGVNYDLDIGNMTLSQGNDTPFSHGQQLCEISRSDKWEEVMALTRCSQTDRWTDGLTDRWTDSMISIYPLNYVGV